MTGNYDLISNFIASVPYTLSPTPYSGGGIEEVKCHRTQRRPIINFDKRSSERCATFSTSRSDLRNLMSVAWVVLVSLEVGGESETLHAMNYEFQLGI